MSENSEKKPEAQPIVIVIQMNPSTGEIVCQHPQNPVVVLGMLEYTHEMMMMKFVRPSLMPRVEGANSLPPHILPFKGAH